jgi:hypothetical protein
MSRRPWLWLTAVFLVLVAVTAVWVSIDRRPPEWDHANHLERALRCHRSLAEGQIWAAISGDSAFYPPLVPCAAGVLYFVFPVAPLTAQAVMLAFLALGMAAVFGVGRILWDDRAGLIAAFLFGTAPFVVFSLLNFQLDLPLASIVALTLWITLRTEGFRRPAWAAALGVVIGLGLLTKPTYLVYVAAPYSISLRGPRAARRRRLTLASPRASRRGHRAAARAAHRGMPFQVVDRRSAGAEPTRRAVLGRGSCSARVFQPCRASPASLPSGPLGAQVDRGARPICGSRRCLRFVFSTVQNRNLRHAAPAAVAALIATAGVRSFSMSWRVAVVASSPWPRSRCR